MTEQKQAIQSLNNAMFAAADAARILEARGSDKTERALNIKRRIVRLRNDLIREYENELEENQS